MVLVHTQMGNSFRVDDLIKSKSQWSNAQYASIRDSIFRIYSRPDCDSSTFCGCAWKYDDDNLMTCWHVVGETQIRATMNEYGERVPSGQLHRRHYYAQSNGHVYHVEPVPHNRDLDFCLLRFTTRCTERALEQNHEGISMGDYCWVFGYATGAVARFIDGTCGNRLRNSRERTANFPADHCMSGSAIFDVQGHVIGMLTGGVGIASVVTRFLPIDILSGFV